jgi:hypothetical protein
MYSQTLKTYDTLRNGKQLETMLPTAPRYTFNIFPLSSYKTK